MWTTMTISTLAEEFPLAERTTILNIITEKHKPRCLWNSIKNKLCEVDGRFWVFINKTQMTCFLALLRATRPGYPTTPPQPNNTQCTGAIQLHQNQNILLARHGKWRLPFSAMIRALFWLNPRHVVQQLQLLSTAKRSPNQDGAREIINGKE